MINYEAIFMFSSQLKDVEATSISIVEDRDLNPTST